MSEYESFLSKYCLITRSLIQIFEGQDVLQQLLMMNVSHINSLIIIISWTAAELRSTGTGAMSHSLLESMFLTPAASPPSTTAARMSSLCPRKRPAWRSTPQDAWTSSPPRFRTMLELLEVLVLESGFFRWNIFQGYISLNVLMFSFLECSSPVSWPTPSRRNMKQFNRFPQKSCLAYVGH